MERLGMKSILNHGINAAIKSILNNGSNIALTSCLSTRPRMLFCAATIVSSKKKRESFMVKGF
jgi:hypothetical protein